MNIHLPPELERLVAESIEKDEYTTASELVAAALWRHFIARESRERLKAQFDREIQEAIDEVERGEFFTAEEARRIFRQPAKETRG